MSFADYGLGREHFAAGKKDEAIYTRSETYRRGWQQARRDAEASQDTSAAPAPVKPKETPKSPTIGTLEWEMANLPTSDGKKVTAEDVKLASGEEKPRKPKPADPDQLAFF